jgi:very-short-patch-repair endonuclease
MRRYTSRRGVAGLRLRERFLPATTLTRAVCSAVTNLSLKISAPGNSAALGGFMRHRFQHSLNFKARYVLSPYARDMRISPTRSEALLWTVIRGSATGVRFRRQVVLGDFIVDFFASSVSLIVEVDGPVHQERIEVDRARDAGFAARGLRVLRISALLVESDLDGAVTLIREAI